LDIYLFLLIKHYIRDAPLGICSAGPLFLEKSGAKKRELEKI